LTVSGFRGIDSLSIQRLGRVTLLGGRNGVGKTTVLEAVATYAARASPNALHELLRKREELIEAVDEDHDPVVYPDYGALFHGRAAIRERPIIAIGPTLGANGLRIEVSTPADWSPEQKDLFADFSTETDVRAVKVVYRDNERLLPWLPGVSDPRAAWSRRRYQRSLQRSLFDEVDWPVIDCESLGPGMPSNNRLARFWDSVALTKEEDLAVEALGLTCNGIERAAMVGDKETRYSVIGRRAVVKLQDHARPVPLKSLGDGATRVFAAALALANSRDGFLLVDEAENGIHYSVQQDFWRMILRGAHQYNVQVLATTHSLDCVTGFARAALDLDEVLGVYLRLERDGDHVRAVEYTEEELATVADQGIEVR
jgi:ABC-type Mn2+/Zn2+ transport system ATPase subunit